MNIRIVLFMIICLVACQAAQESKQKKAMTNEPPLETSSQDTIKYPQILNEAFVLGQFEPSTQTDFVEVPIQMADRKGMYLHKDCMQAFAEMWNKARKDGIKLVVRSAARNFEYQKSIWEAKWSGARKLSGGINAAVQFESPMSRAQEIMKYSAMPGASRHHWGTEVDLNAFENSYFESGEGQKVFEWLESNAAAFGFCRPYTEKGSERLSGYEEEKWHWSYLPISDELTRYAANKLHDHSLKNFSGYEQAAKIGVWEKYVLGIHPTCK